MLNFRSMYIMADLGDHADGSHTNERTLVSLKAQPDGSLLMRPGFSQPGFTYKFEDLHGGVARARPGVCLSPQQLQCVRACVCRGGVGPTSDPTLDPDAHQR